MRDETADGEVAEDDKLARLSKVVKTGCVETFDWQFQEPVFKDGRKTEKFVTKEVRDL